jgi:DNA polymerase I
MEQAGITDFGDGEEDRPAAEAAVVAGNGGQDPSATVDADTVGLPEADGHLELAVMQVDYGIEGSGDDEEPLIHVFGRTEADDLEHVTVVGFRPYFYAPTDDVSADLPERNSKITGVEPGFESIKGEPLTRIYGKTPRDVGNIRDQFDHYEADILFPNRFLIDKGIKEGVRVPARRTEDGRVVVHHEEVEAASVEATPRVNTFDIEVDDRSGFPEEGEEPIICLASHDSYDDEYVVWVFESRDAEVGLPTDLHDYDPITEGAEFEVRSFETEEAMLDAFLAYIEETDPDVTTGWNCLPGDSEVLMADGTTKEIQAVEVGNEVVGSANRETAIAEVTNKWQSEKEILEFGLADGTTIRSSDQHRIMVGDDESVDWKEAGDIEADDYVLKPRRLNIENPTIPALSDLVPVENQRFVNAEAVKEFKDQLPYGAVTELSEEFDVATGTLYHPHTDVWTPVRCKQAASMYEVAVPDGGRVYRRSGSELDRQLTEHELYLAGLIITDGSMSPDDGVRFYNTRKELHEQFPGETYLEPDGKGCYKQNVLDYARMYAFNGLGIPFGDKNAVDIDLSTIYGMPEDYIARFLAGVIDGDGNVASSVSVAAENETLGEWYVKLFKRLGVYAERNDNIVRVPNAERDIAVIRDLVAPYMAHSGKVTKLQAVTGGKSGRTEDIPYALFDAETGSDEKRIGRDKHRRGINLKRHETTVEGWTDYVFVQVEGVESIGTETTYDIETTTHNFIAEDCLVHNCDDFDIPYLLDRLERLSGRHHDHDLRIERLSRIGEVWRSDWGGPDVKGRVVFDLLYAYQRTQFSELDSYRLDAVAETELGVGKERYAGSIGDLWEQDPERLLEYNLRDVELCVEIDDRQQVIAFWDEVRTFVGCKLEDATTPGDAVDMYVLHKAYGNFVLPSKGGQEAEEYEGGAVFEPISGVRENVSVLDLKSLYPMAMATINASPETRVPEDYDGETYRAPNETYFQKNPDGIMREMIDELLDEREEKKSRRNDFDPGSETYDLYDRQQQAVKVIMNCFTPDTEVLTPDGVRLITDLDVGDEVYSLDVETMQMEVKPVVETHAYPDYDGELVDIQTSKIDFRVTPNHRMVVRKNETNGITDDYRFIQAGNLDRASNYELPHGWSGPEGEPLDEIDLTELVVGDYEVWVRPSVHGHTFTAELGWTPRRVPKADVGETGYVFTAEEFEAHREYVESVCEYSFVHRKSGRKWIPRTYDADDFLDLLAWYVTEGNVYTSEDKQFGEQFRGSATTIQIAQDATTLADGGTDHHASIGDLLDRMGFDYYVDDRSYQFTSKLLGDLLERLCGGDSFEKRIPAFVFDLDQRAKRRFLDGLIDGDADWQTNAWRHTTSSVRLRDDVLRLCAHLGLTANYNHDSGSWRISVTESSKNTLRMHRSSSTSTAEDGVYCVTVADNHTLLAGRNGTFQFVGQSLYGVSGWVRFRLYDSETAAAVTATGRDVIEFTEEAASERDMEVVYGDTDSVMLELGHDVSKEDAISQSFAIEEYINDRYDEFALEEFNAQFHRFQIEFEKLYRRFFQAGKKKRYAGHIVWKEGKDVDDIDITGFEYKRSDIAPITKEVQKQVIEMIVTGVDIDDVKQYVRGVTEDFAAGNADLEDIAIPGGIGKRLDNYDTDTAHVRGAKYANLLLGTNFQRGSKPKRLYLERVQPTYFERFKDDHPELFPNGDGMGTRGSLSREQRKQRALFDEFRTNPDVICFEYTDQIPEEFDVHWEKMLEKTLKGPIARILEALDVSWEEIRSGQQQTGLGSFT